MARKHSSTPMQVMRRQMANTPISQRPKPAPFKRQHVPRGVKIGQGLGTLEADGYRPPAGTIEKLLQDDRE